MIESWRYPSSVAAYGDVMDIIVGTTASGTYIRFDTTTKAIGTQSLRVDKVSTAFHCYMGRRFALPWDLRYFKHHGYTLDIDFYHATFTNITQVGCWLAYAVDESTGGLGGTSKYERWVTDAAGVLTGGAWNTVSFDLSSPTVSVGSPTDADRMKVVAGGFWTTVTTDTDTWADLYIDAMRFGGKPYATLWTGGNHNPLPLPPFDIWNRGREFKGWRNFTPTNVETVPGPQFETIEFGYKQTRRVHDQDANLHTVEDSLRAFDLYTQENDGWAVAFPGHEIADGLLNADRLASGTSYSWYTDQQFVDDYTWLCGGAVPALGDAYGAHKAVRVGPNPQGQVSRSLLIGNPATQHCTRMARCPLDHFQYEPIRSMGYYPNLARLSNEPALRETGSAAEFRMKARAIG